jgi:hypothetical protein
MRKFHIFCFSLLAIAMLALPAASSAQVVVGVSIRIGPPALPVYVQPVCPAPGYIWTPGYWAYGPDGYYWVPGTWVLAPVGLLWTPGYWGGAGGFYVWHGGYWGPHVGFYGGINYGFGYGGVGFVGGRWDRGVFAYNTAVTNVNTTVIHNTYVNKTVIVNNTTVNRVSFNGGAGGTTAHATAIERSAERERHTPPTAMQTQHEHSAGTNRALLASENHGRPSIAATSKPGEFTGHGVVAARTVSTPRNASARTEADRPPSHNAGTAHPNNTNSTHNAPAHSDAHKPPAKSSTAPSHEHKGTPHPEGKPHSSGEKERPR